MSSLIIGVLNEKAFSHQKYVSFNHVNYLAENLNKIETKKRKSFCN